MRALHEARRELGAALLALTLTAPTRASAARTAEAARLHVVSAAAVLDAVQDGANVWLIDEPAELVA